MNKFNESELIGRLKFQSLLDLTSITDYSFTEDAFNWVDCYYLYKNKTVAVEIKVRSLLWDTLFMEVTKYKEMKLLIKENKADAGLYVNFIGDRCYIFSLKQITKANGCTISKVYSNRTTAEDSGKKVKTMIEIPIKLAYVLLFKNGNR